MRKQTPGLTLDAAAKRLRTLRRLAHLERKELGAVSPRTLRAIESAIAAAEAVCIVDDARSPVTKLTA